MARTERIKKAWTVEFAREVFQHRAKGCRYDQIQSLMNNLITADTARALISQVRRGHVFKEQRNEFLGMLGERANDGPIVASSSDSSSVVPTDIPKVGGDETGDGNHRIVPGDDELAVLYEAGSGKFTGRDLATIGHGLLGCKSGREIAQNLGGRFTGKQVSKLVFDARHGWRRFTIDKLKELGRRYGRLRGADVDDAPKADPDVPPPPLAGFEAADDLADFSGHPESDGAEETPSTSHQQDAPVFPAQLLGVVTDPMLLGPGDPIREDEPGPEAISELERRKRRALADEALGVSPRFRAWSSTSGGGHRKLGLSSEGAGGPQQLVQGDDRSEKAKTRKVPSVDRASLEIKTIDQTAWGNLRFRFGCDGLVETYGGW